MPDVQTTLASFEQPVAPTDAVLRSLEDLYTDAVLAAWQEKGFSDIRPLETEFPCRLYSASFGAASLRSVLAMPAPAAGYLRLSAISEAQYRRIEREFVQADVYYAALVLTEQAFELFGPVRIRENGAWLTDDIDTDQYLPRAHREHEGGIYGLLLGDAFWYKHLHVLLPRIAEAGTACIPSVQGLETEERRNRQYFYLSSPQEFPCWKGLVEIVGEGEEKHLQFCHAVFCPLTEEVPLSELELIARSEEHAVYGLVELMGPTGYRLWAESAEAVVYGAGMPLGRRYRWNLWMVADECSNNAQEIPVPPGSLYDTMREAYIEEHGEAPPAGHVFTLSTAHMRALNQLDEDEYAASCMLCGVVEELRAVPLPAAEFPDSRCLMAVLRCIPDDEESTVCVYLPAAALGDYVPKVGDNIACSGTLHASAQELLETTESWQDSAEIAMRTEARASDGDAHHYFELCAESSLALAAVVVAFVKGGWTVEQYDSDRFSRQHVPLCVRNQRGELTSVFIDTVIDGHAPQYSYASQRAAIEDACREKSETAVFATVELTYRSDGDCYAVRMVLSPEQEGVDNTVTECSEGFRASVPRLTEEGWKEESLRPERLDEAAAAQLLCRAFSEGRWAEAAKWMREEMRYCSRAVGTELYGKTDYLRYITERIEGWKAAGRWHRFSFAVGSLLHEGKRRACMAMCYEGVPTGMLIFNDSCGLIGSMEAVPDTEFAGFTAETPLCNLDVPEGVCPVLHSECLFRPEHGYPALPDMPQQSDFAQLVESVVRFLQQRGTPCVARHAEPDLLPHLWFRDSDGRLAYICLLHDAASTRNLGIPADHYAGYRATRTEQGGIVLFPMR